MSEPRPEDLIAAIRQRDPACGSTVVVAIDGPSGAGKTKLTRELAPGLGATILHLDDIYRGWEGLADAPPVVVHDVLEPLARGQAGRTPRWEWGADQPGEPLVVPPDPFLILDGCGSGSRVIRPFLSYLIWMDGPEDVRRARALSRDGELYEQWWDIWAAQERELFAAEGTERAADVRLRHDVDT